MPRHRTGEGWRPFLLVALAGLLIIYAVSRLDLEQFQSATVMVIVAILVVASYERFVGWG